MAKKNIDKLPPIQTTFDHFNNDDLFNLILDQRAVINELIDRVNSQETSRKTKFEPPTIEEVEKYCRYNRYTIDPVQFVAYYESNGWMVGRQKMNNWKAAVVTWVKRQEPKKEVHHQKPLY